VFPLSLVDRPVTITYPTGEVVTNGYNGRGLPNTLSGTAAGTLVTGTLYNALGGMTDLNLNNGAKTTYGYYGPVSSTGYDTAGGFYGRLWEIKTTKQPGGTPVLQDARYSWDPAGNLTQRQDRVNIETENFTYDLVDRLTAASGPYSETYSYNALGNITSKNGTAYTYYSNDSIPQSGLIAKYNLDEGSGTVAADSAGTNNGVLTNGPTWIETQHGKGVDFDGINDYIGLSQPLVFTTGFTFSTWVRRGADQGGDIFNNNQFFLRVQPENENAGNPFEAFITLSNGQVEPRVQSGVPANVGQWYFVTVSWNGTLLKIYVDGELKGTTTRSGSLTTTTVAASLGCGEMMYPNVNYWKGDIDEVRFYNRALTDNEVKILYSVKPHAVAAVGAISYAYDANGNMTKRGTQTLGWDVENRLLTVSGGASFVYDGDGNRIKKTEGGITTLYINRYYEKTGTEVTTSYYLGSKLIAQRKGISPNYTLSYVMQDHLGSTSATASDAGVRTSTITYFPFGSIRATTGTVPTDKKFTGQRLDATGLYYYNARYYDTNLGRFISPDTIVPDLSSL
jgi:RHS repeat-associated protein